ncbi:MULTISPECIES: sugar ABC transporter permease [unclassified Paenibacillus]|uniref:carbohydrate ABC transporter permease n=1 Tax=unclassified Paenibacillus TaxID=185978 RepID=UPI0010534767|nr:MULTISPECIES: sugar ABC transporter permease [unclassified Paenibacillus]NIK66881.1 raffinose/stachyose/melibiose transport system permease protein [Paenibacillus sp. BK720]TCN00923.1 carbohydrate ABC transporter membrane protein 1 (CUT1 family) [Paenibacillus sp. BK033]
MNKALRNPYTYIAFILPTLVLYALFFVYPVIVSFVYGFFQWDGITQKVFIGLDNFTRLWKDHVFLKSLVNNFYFMAFSLIVNIPLVFLISILISKVGRMRDFYKSAVFVPVVISTATVAILFGVLYNYDSGLINQFIRLVAPDSWAREWLSDPKLAMLSILLANAWQNIGFFIVLCLAAILNIPKEIVEASKIDGINGWNETWLITLPLIRPVLFVMLLLTVSGTMKVLDIVQIMTNGGPFQSTEVMSTYMLKVGFRSMELGYGSAIGVTMFILILVLTGILQKLTKHEEVQY